MRNLNLTIAVIFYLPAVLAIIVGAIILMVAHTPVVLLAGIIYAGIVSIMLTILGIVLKENTFTFITNN